MPLSIMETAASASPDLLRISKPAEPKGMLPIFPFLDLRRDDGIWELKEVEGLEAKLELSSISVELALADVYEEVSFEKKPPK